MEDLGKPPRERGRRCNVAPRKGNWHRTSEYKGGDCGAGNHQGGTINKKLC